MSFPIELKKMKRWVGYRLVPDKDGGKPRKVPVNAVTGQNAKSNAPETWTDYETAKAAAKKYGYSGIGFMFVKEDGFVGIDIDHCYDPAAQTFNEVAAAIMAKQPTYMEFSPSGDGVHLWFKGEKPRGASKNTETGIEMYDTLRYFTVTENQIPGTPDTVETALPDTLSWIHENYLAKKKPAKKKKSKTAGEKLTDEEIIEKASAAGNGEVFTDLMDGKWEGRYPSQSEADMALCMKLAFWSGKDKAQMDRMFRASGLMREKWDVPHHAGGATYGEETLDRAIESTESVYNPMGDSPIFEYDGRYFRAKGDSVYPITNFVIRPVEMLIGEDEAQMTGDFVTSRGETFRLTFLTNVFDTQPKFKSLLNSRTIALGWFGSDGDLELLNAFVYELDWTVKTGVKALGIYEHIGRPVFASSEGSVEKGGAPVDDLVQLDKYVSIQTGILKTDVLTAEQLKDLGSFILGYNEPEKTIAILAWCAGCFIKPHLKKAGIKYPHLFLIGEAGSGKSTTLEKVVLPIFSASRVTAATQVTQFTLMKDAASSNLVPMALDEFKPSKIDKLKINALYNHFRDSYDGHEGLRGRADQSVVTYELLAPLVVAGEESADEAAIRERSVELLFSKKDLKRPEYRDNFARVRANTEMLRDFGRTVLEMALSVRPAQAEQWHKEGMTHFSGELPSRVVNNLACCYAGLKLLEALCARMGLLFSDVYHYGFDPCIRYLEHGAKEYLLDGGTNNQSVIEQSFEIMARMGLDDRTDFILSEDKTLLFIRLSRVYDKYTKYRKDYAIVGEVLTYTQFRKQLMHSDVYLQHNAQHKFNGKNCKCWVVNYAALMERCDVSGFDTEDEDVAPPLL